MRWQKTLQLVDVHCEGEVGKVITGGVLNIPGASILDKLNYLNDVDDSLRRFVICEPRGSLAMSVNLLLPPVHPEADAAFVIFQADKTHPMSGSNSICVVTALLELGMVPVQEPITNVVLETAVGLVRAQAHCKDGRCQSVTLTMTPSFAERLDFSFDSPTFGKITLDIAFGGVFYGLVDVSQINLALASQNARQLADAGAILCRELNAAISVCHPEYPSINHIAYVMFRNTLDAHTVQTCTTLPPGRIDRSPCGTGSSANLATLAARGLVKKGDVLTSRSTIGGEFAVRYHDDVMVGDRHAIVPQVTGRAWVYGIHQLGIDPDDPLAQGFMLSDTWGEFTKLSK
ncbi:proline racemase [Moraxella caviae]|uniref:Proline racemase n=1 Tax=Moraxella caviae TaxID=34060 RepID=A0A1S9ZWN1_9GAMM|nr:proline racemase family protein [Moraxella caviae]OOR87799.1 proline racemase [Moraxella caviae]STZ10555.1 proline racemase [Moraxella caviae]VEW12973.1 proline racemase [Moraxella caviae]